VEQLTHRYNVLKPVVLANVDLLRTEREKTANSIQRTKATAQQAAAAARQKKGGRAKETVTSALGLSSANHISLGKPLPPLSEEERNRLCVVPFYIVPALDKRLALSAEGSLVFLTLLADDENEDATEEEKEEIRRHVPPTVYQKWCFTYHGEIVLCCEKPQKLVVCRRADEDVPVPLRLDTGAPPVELRLVPYKPQALPPPRPGQPGRGLAPGTRWSLRAESQTLSTFLDLNGGDSAPRSFEMDEARRLSSLWFLQAGRPLTDGPYREVTVRNKTEDISQQWFIKR